jgi:hypothetical protein
VTAPRLPSTLVDMGMTHLPKRSRSDIALSIDRLFSVVTSHFVTGVNL